MHSTRWYRRTRGRNRSGRLRGATRGPSSASSSSVHPAAVLSTTFGTRATRYTFRPEMASVSRSDRCWVSVGDRLGRRSPAAFGLSFAEVVEHVAHYGDADVDERAHGEYTRDRVP